MGKLGRSLTHSLSRKIHWVPLQDADLLNLFDSQLEGVPIGLVSQATHLKLITKADCEDSSNQLILRRLHLLWTNNVCAKRLQSIQDSLGCFCTS